MKMLCMVFPRWNSTLDMINRFLEQRTAIYAALEDLKTQSVHHLDESQIKALRELSGLLRPFKLATQTHSADKACTISSVHPLKHKLLEQLRSAQVTCDAVKKAKNAMIADLNTRYNDATSDLMLQEACILDPRFKSVPHLSPAERKHLVTYLVSHCMSLEQCYGHGDADQDDGDLAVVLVPESSAPPPDATALQSELQTLLGDMFSGDGPSESRPSGSAREPLNVTAQREVDFYMKEPSTAFGECPLVWWRNNQRKYPMLSRVAQHILVIQSTSVSSERVFSTAGDLVSAKRNRLESELVDQIVFLNKNFGLV